MVNPITSLLLKTRRLYEAVYLFDEAAASKLGIHSSDLRCINALEHGSLTAGEIGERLGLTSGSVTALVNRLEKAGFVVKNRSTTDARQVEVSLKPSFYQHAETIYGKLGKSLSTQFQEMSAEELERATAVIERLITGFKQAK